MFCGQAHAAWESCLQISKIETIRFNRGITVHAGAVNWLWVRAHTDEGTIGLGETYPAAEAAEVVIAHSSPTLDLQAKVGWKHRRNPDSA